MVEGGEASVEAKKTKHVEEPVALHLVSMNLPLKNTILIHFSISQNANRRVLPKEMLDGRRTTSFSVAYS